MRKIMNLSKLSRINNKWQFTVHYKRNGNYQFIISDKFNTKLEAMVAWDEMIIKYELKTKKFFPLNVKIPSKLDLMVNDQKHIEY